MQNEKQKILIFGGTGAMGMHIVDILSRQGYSVYVTSRSQHVPYGNVKYIEGNAKNDAFVKALLEEQWDVIIDFMVYGTREFRKRIDLLLSNTSQYIFISSARVYADSKLPLTEDSPRLLDVTTDEEYLKTDEYALSKARQEDALYKSGKNNWTIIRPSLTYDKIRLQLGVLEKENWVYRAMRGRTIVFSEDIASNLYNMTTGYDVARGIAALVGHSEALGEAYHIVSNQSYQWNDILGIYLDVMEEKMGKRPEVVMTEKCVNLNIEGAKYQVIYGRYFSRIFDNTKIREFVDTDSFEDAKDGLRRCLSEFLEKPKFRRTNWMIEALLDRATGEKTPLCEISTMRERIIYCSYRFGFEKVISYIRRLRMRK